MREERIGCFLLIAVLLVLYLASVFNAFFEYAEGYVYHPATDRLYRIEFTHDPLPTDRWRYFIPAFGPRPNERSVEAGAVSEERHEPTESASAKRNLNETPAGEGQHLADRVPPEPERDEKPPGQAADPPLVARPAEPGP